MKATGWEILLYVMLYLVLSRCSSQEKQVLNWYSFISHKYVTWYQIAQRILYSLNAIVTCLIALKTLKCQKIFGLYLQKH